MIEVLSGAEIIFNPSSETDQRLTGSLILKNPSAERYTVFKVKSTNVSAFQAEPSKGIISPRETLTIKIQTTKPVDAEYAKVLSQNNKFLLQYAILISKPYSLDEALSELKGSTAQSIKIYINTSSVRGSHLGKSNKEPSIGMSNRYSFHSMGQNGHNSRPSPNTLVIQQPNDELDRLKYEIESLQKQRARLSKDIDSKGKNNKKGGILKYVIVLAFGVIAGNVGGHYAGVNSFIKEKVSNLSKPKPEVKNQEEGFFSIFNFGGDDAEAAAKKQQKSWWDIF